MKKTRVLVVDDSALMRKMIPRMLKNNPSLEVVGTAMDGIFALKKIETLKPDVVTLDMDMPRMDGIETLKNIMKNYGTPTVIVSSLARREADLTLQALELGAFDFVTKPQSAISVHIDEIAEELVNKVRAAASDPLARLKVKTIDPGAVARKTPRRREPRVAERVLAIGISTGGPNALSYMLPGLPADFPAAIVIVQHMPPPFTQMLAERLDSISAIEVKEASEGDLLLPGRALVAPGGRHLKVKRMPFGTICVLSRSSEVNGHRPSVDVLFESVAAEFGSGATGLIMTGMGEDGAAGIGAIKARGGMTLAQDEESSIVYGMPKEAVRRGHVSSVVPLEEMAPYLIEHFKRKETNSHAIECDQDWSEEVQVHHCG